jgi:hypothetical protein
LEWTKTLLDVIDTQSFSSLWFWIVLAVVWSTASHWVIGVPYDMLLRARRQGGQALVDLEDIVRVNVNRILYITRESGMWLLGFVSFILTGLLVLALWYRIEFAQAVSLIAVPMTLVGMMTLFTARKIEAEGLAAETLFRRLTRHRFWTQVIGMLSIFITAMYGMFYNLAVVPGF